MWVQAAKDAEAKCKQLEHIWFNASRHHFPAWHTQALYRNVWNAVCFARSRKIDVELSIQDCFANNRDLQRQLYKALLSSGNDTYFPLYRLRSNLKRWRLQPFGDISCRRARNCLNIISKECPPRVWFAVFRAMWNGCGLHLDVCAQCRALTCNLLANWVVLMVRMNWNTTAYAICFGHFCALLGQLG